MPTTLDVAQAIDHARPGRFQFGLLFMCGLCLILDGFDVQSMGYVAPAIIRDWGIERASLGPVFGAGLFGMLLGALAFSALADRLGRRPVLIGATLFFSLCMLATPWVHQVSTLLALRFVTGLGLGAIMPNAMSLAGEYSPSRSRVTRMMLVSCGFTLGAALGGFLSAWLIPRLGWSAVFIVGGIVPLLLALTMLAWLPESIQFLVLRGRAHGRDRQRIAGWLQRIDPSVRLASDTRLLVSEPPAAGMPVVQLFQSGRASVTILLWIVNFMNLINLYFLSNWLPTLVRDAGYATDTAVLVGTTLQVGGVIGTLALGRLVERLGFVRVLGTCFAIACVAIATIGRSAAALPLLAGAVFVAGFCVVGGQPAVNALAAVYYPTALRSTGIGWSLGIGRIGSVVGPVIGGQLIALHWSNASLFVAAAIPAAISAVMIAALALRGDPARRPPAPQVGQAG